MDAEITEQMCVAALEAYWGKRLYSPNKSQQWTDKEMQGMHDAIKAALDALDKDANAGDSVDLPVCIYTVTR